MSKIALLAACLAIITAATINQPAARAAEAAAQRLDELRAKVAADPQVQEAKAAIVNAEKAMQEKIVSDPAIAEARRTEQAAREAVAKAEQAAAATDPRVQEHRRTLEAARARASELEMQRKVEETKTEHLRNEARSRPDLRELWSKAHVHPLAPETAAADPRLAAARKKVDEANAALEKKTKELGEYRAVEQARKEFDEAVQASQRLKDAAAARRAVEEKVMADEKVAAQAAKVKAAGEAQAAHRKTIDEIEKKIRDVSAEVAAKDARVAEAMKAVAEARDRLGRTIEERLATERKARDAAQAAWREKCEKAIAENPEAKALMNEMRSLEERLQQLRSQMGELRRP